MKYYLLTLAYRMHSTFDWDYENIPLKEDWAEWMVKIVKNVRDRQYVIQNVLEITEKQYEHMESIYG